MRNNRLSRPSRLMRLKGYSTPAAWTPANISAVFAPDVTAMRAANKLYSLTNGGGSAVTTNGSTVNSFRDTLSNVICNYGGSGNPWTLTDLGGGKWGLTASDDVAQYTSGTVTGVSQCLFGAAKRANFATVVDAPISGGGAADAPYHYLDGSGNTVYVSPDGANFATLDITGSGLTTAYYTILAQRINASGTNTLNYVTRFNFTSGAYIKTQADLVDGGGMTGTAFGTLTTVAFGPGAGILTRAIMAPAPVSAGDFAEAVAWLAAGNP